MAFVRINIKDFIGECTVDELIAELEKREKTISQNHREEMATFSLRKFMGLERDNFAHELPKERKKQCILMLFNKITYFPDLLDEIKELFEK